MASTAQERIAGILFDYKFVSGAESRVINTVDRTKTKFRQLAAEAKALDVPFGGITRASETLAQRLRGSTAPATDIASREFRELRKDVLDATTAIERLDTVAASTSASVSTSGGRRGAGLERIGRGAGLERIGRGLVELPSVMLPGGFSTNDIGQAARALGVAGVSLAAVGTAALVAAPVLAAVAVGVGLLTERYREQEAAAEAAIEAARQAQAEQNRLLIQAGENATAIYNIVAGGDESGNRAALRAVQNERSNTQEVITGLRQAIYQDDIAIAQLAETRRQAEADLDRAETRFAETGTPEAATAAMAARDALDAATQRLSELEAQRADTLALVADQQTKLAAVQNEVAVRTEAATALLADFSDEIERFNEEGRDFLALDIDLDALIGGIAQADLEAAIENVTNAEERRIREEERLLVAQEALTEASAQSAAKLIQIEQDLIDKTAEIERSRGIDLSEAERNAGLERTKAVEENNEALEGLEIDHRERLAKIAKDANRDLQNAVGERDALAAYQAQQAAAQATEEENAEYDKRRKEINKRLEDTNRDIDRKLQEQQRSINRRYDEQLRTAQKAAQKAVELEIARAQAQLTILTNAYNAQLALTQQWRDKVISLTADVANAASGIKTGTPTGSENKSGGGVSTSVSPTTLGYVPRFAVGGRPALNRVVEINDGNGIESALIDGRRFARFTMPTQIYSAEQTRRMMSGGTVININLDGETIRATSRQQALNVIGGILEKKGVA